MARRARRRKTLHAITLSEAPMALKASAETAQVLADGLIAAGLTAYSQPSEEPKAIAILVSPVQILEKQLPGADPFGVDLGPDGAFWFAESNQKRLLRMATDGSVTELTGLEGSPRQIAAGPGNTLWVTEEGVNKVARVSGVGIDTGGGGGGGGGGGFSGGGGSFGGGGSSGSW